MDINLITSINRLDKSPIPTEMFLRQVWKYDPLRKNVNWAPFKAEWSPFRELAKKDRWKKGFRNARKTGEVDLANYLIKTLLESNWLEGQQIPEQNIPPIYDAWHGYLDYTKDYFSKSKNHPSNKILQFITTQGNLKMNGVDTAIWMLIAHQELTLVESGNEVGSGNNANCKGITYDFAQWLPAEEDTKLISTKRRVLKIIYELYGRENSNDIDIDEQKKVFRDLMKPKYLTPNVKTSLLTHSRLERFIPLKITDSITGENLERSKSAFYSHLNLLINYAEFLEHIQSILVNNNIPNHTIVEMFSHHEGIKASFYNKLDAYLAKDQ